MKTQVAIIGAGPAGLALSHTLSLRGIESVILESKSREYALSRIRAGVLEQGSVDFLRKIGAAERLNKEALPHHAIDIGVNGNLNRIDITELTNGQQVWVYGQTEIVKDFFKLHETAGREIKFNCEVLRLEDLIGDVSKVTYTEGGVEKTLHCDFVAGCDGFWGISRGEIPSDVLRTYSSDFPYSWLGILADAAPSNDVVIYANHENGFGLLSMRSPSVTRLYIQVDNEDTVDDWSDEAIWSELELRLNKTLIRGPVTQKGITPMRSFVAAPMQYGNLMLAGDAGHIVPPTGAKGLNLALADVSVLSSALINHYKKGDETLLRTYGETVLRRVWKVERFSHHTTTLTHTNKAHTPFERQLQIADLDYLGTSRAAQLSFAENYVGLPVAASPDV